MQPTTGSEAMPPITPPMDPRQAAEVWLKLLELIYTLAKKFYEQFLDAYPTYREGDFLDSDSVDGEPAVGSVVWCDLGDFAHSGVYIGDGKIMHLTGKFKGSHIEPCDAKGFSEGKPIFVSCKGRKAVGYQKAAAYAKKCDGEERDYNLVKNNCHGFVVECFTGNKQDGVRMRKPSDIGEILGMDCWRWWMWDKKDVLPNSIAALALGAFGGKR